MRRNSCPALLSTSATTAPGGNLAIQTWSQISLYQAVGQGPVAYILHTKTTCSVPHTLREVYLLKLKYSMLVEPDYIISYSTTRRFFCNRGSTMCWTCPRILPNPYMSSTITWLPIPQCLHNVRSQYRSFPTRGPTKNFCFCLIWLRIPRYTLHIWWSASWLNAL